MRYKTYAKKEKEQGNSKRNSSNKYLSFGFQRAALSKRPHTKEKKKKKVANGKNKQRKVRLVTECLPQCIPLVTIIKINT